MRGEQQKNGESLGWKNKTACLAGEIQRANATWFVHGKIHGAGKNDCAARPEQHKKVRQSEEADERTKGIRRPGNFRNLKGDFAFARSQQVVPLKSRQMYTVR